MDERAELLKMAGEAKALIEARRKSLGEARVLLDRPLSQGPDAAPEPLRAAPGASLPDEAPPLENPQAPWAEGLDAFYLQVRGCRRCGLGAARRHFVFGEGDPGAAVAFVGEAPGAEEDAQGRPFVGEAGRMLDKIIAGMGLRREAVYLCNTVKCRPPFNRAPEAAEAEACRPYLEHQLALVRPRVVVALGEGPTRALLGAGADFAALRGKPASWRGVTVVPTHPPAEVLKNAALKRPVWEDMKLVLEILRKARA